MADNLLGLAQVLGAQPPGSGPSGAAGVGGGDPGGIAERIKRWYMTELATPFWQDYIKNAKIDRGFYIGGEHQWVDNDGNHADLTHLKGSRRAHVSINHIKPVVKVLTGLERQTRMNLTVTPEGQEDDDDARYMSWLMVFTQKQAHIPEQRSAAFKGALIEGMRVLTCEIDYLDEPVAGEIVSRVLTPGDDCIWDHNALRLDFGDASFFLEFRWSWVEDVVAQYPDQREAIEAAIAGLTMVLQDTTGGVSRGPSGDAYGSSLAPIMDGPNDLRAFYDEINKRVLVITAWWPDYEMVHYVYDKAASKTIEVGSAQAATDLVKSDEEHLTKIRRQQRYLRTATVLPATGHVLEGGPTGTETPYVNDRKNYPYVLELGERVGDDVRGLVRDLRDEQRVENKRVSSGLDLASRWGKIRRTAEEGTIAPQSLQSLDDAMAESTIFYSRGAKPPGWDVPTGLSELIRLQVGLGDAMKQNIWQSSGVNPELQGIQREAGQSGIAIARRQAQGQVIATEVFDNHRLTGEFFGRLLGRRIQQKFTQEEYIRLTNDIGAGILVHLNPPAFRDLSTDSEDNRAKRKQMRAKLAQQGKPPVLANVDKLKWDLTVAETPASPTARAEAAQNLLELIKLNPAYFPILADIIIKMMDGLPDKPLILQRLAALQGMTAPGPGAPPPAGGPSMTTQPTGPPGAGPAQPQAGNEGPQTVQPLPAGVGP